MRSVTKKSHLCVVLFAICLISIIPTCNNKKEVLTPTNPCQDHSNYFPDFVIKENEFESSGTDTVLINSYVSFQAPNKYLEYEWKIGNDPPTYTGSELSLFFD